MSQLACIGRTCHEVFRKVFQKVDYRCVSTFLWFSMVSSFVLISLSVEVNAETIMTLHSYIHIFCKAYPS
jgi:hypothetical protein